MISDARSFSSLIPTDSFLWLRMAIFYGYYSYLSINSERMSVDSGKPVRNTEAAFCLKPTDFAVSEGNLQESLANRPGQST